MSSTDYEWRPADEQEAGEWLTTGRQYAEGLEYRQTERGVEVRTRTTCPACKSYPWPIMSRATGHDDWTPCHD